MINKRNKIGTVEVIRGIAALSVCLFHFQANMQVSGLEQKYFNKLQLFLGSIFSHGHLGVQAFFVLSGFIIPFSMVKAGYKLNDFFRFFARRCARIEPPYIISILLAIALYYLSSLAPGFKGKPFDIGLGSFLSHLGYLPEHLGYDWILPVYWSLEAEFHFYILIGLILPFVWKSQKALFLFFAIGLILSLFIPLYVIKFMPFFVMGIATCAFKVKKIESAGYWLALILAAVTCLAQGLEMTAPLVGVFTSVLVTYFNIGNRVTVFLGTISFSLYLIHVPIGGRIINLLSRYVSASWQIWILWTLALGVTILASYLFFLLIERPAMRLSKRIVYSNAQSRPEKVLSTAN